MDIYIKKEIRSQKFIPKKRITSKVPIFQSDVSAIRSRYLPFIIKSPEFQNESYSTINPFVVPALRNYSAVRNHPKNAKEYYFKINKVRTFTKTKPMVVNYRANSIKECTNYVPLNSSLDIKINKSELELRHNYSMYEKHDPLKISQTFDVPQPSFILNVDEKTGHRSTACKFEMHEPIQKITIKRKSLDSKCYSEFPHKGYFKPRKISIEETLKP